MAPSRPQIRAFLSSTFSDFLEERSLLVKQVFPELRRKARERGVEVVEVDLRWGITEEQSKQGQTIGICLDEIERCRPYFIGLIGDRYGWVPQLGDYSPELLARENWIAQHQGGASVTELEILHGVLNNPEMAGRAFFYFRDPAYSDAKAAECPGWRSESSEERQKLEALKERIRASGFPVVEKGLATPQAIADRIEADLWSLIEEQYPDASKTDALELEAARHASYRADRTGLYLGGEGYITQLQDWISAGEQRILITGDSGAGKSALIANWVAAHESSQPDDVIFCHHLGSSNDGSALRPLLARMIDSASRLLVEAEELSEPLKVPQGWWELVSQVTNTLSRLSVWAIRQQRRWIWVLDGLDKLDLDDQQALPWLPLVLPEGVHLVVSALDFQVRTLLQERQFTELTIGPLGEAERDQLIQKYLSLYTKELVPALRQMITGHRQGSSPLFLRVLLEELRLCGRFETLAEQLQAYLAAESVADLYELVLQRLEGDGHGDAVQKVMTALWASRAGLSENELLEFTGLVHAQWAPIGIGLQEALSEANGRQVFGHDFLRQAVRDRYLPTEGQRRQVHSELADWFEEREGWDGRDAEEWPWQLKQAGRIADLRDLLLDVDLLSILVADVGSQEVFSYWHIARAEANSELDELIAEDVAKWIEKRREDKKALIWFVKRVASLLNEAGLYRELMLRLRTLSLELEEASEDRSEESIRASLLWLADAYCKMGYYEQAEAYYTRCLEAQERLLGSEHPSTLSTVGSLGVLFEKKGDYEQAEACYMRCLEAHERLLGPEHPDTLATVGNLGALCIDKGNYVKAELYYKRCLEARERMLGPEHRNTLTIVDDMGGLYRYQGDYKQAEAYYKRCIEAEERLLGTEHPDTLKTLNNLGLLYHDMGNYGLAAAYYTRCLEASMRLLGPEHPSTLITVGNLGSLYSAKGDYEQAETYYIRCLEAQKLLLGPEHPDTLNTINDLGGLYLDKGNYEKAKALYLQALEASERLLGRDHPSTLTTVGNLGMLHQDKRDYQQAETYYKRCIEAEERLLGPEHPSTLTTAGNLGGLYLEKGEYEQAEAYFTRVLEARERLLGPEHPETLTSVNNLAVHYLNKGDIEQAEAYHTRCLEARERILGPEHTDTLTTVGNLGALYKDKSDYEQAEWYCTRCLEGQERRLGPEHPKTSSIRYLLANLLSDLERYNESISLRRQEVDVAAKREGRDAIVTLTYINCLADDLYWADELQESEFLYREALSGRIAALGDDDGATMASRYGLARTLSAEKRYEDAIELRKVELEWCRKQNGDQDEDTLTSIHGLAIDLREIGELGEAENLFRELVAGRQQVLEPEDFLIGRSLGGLSKTLEEAGKLEQALKYAQQCLNHRLEYEGINSSYTNRNRLDVARVFHKLERDQEALDMLNQLDASLNSDSELSDDVRQLMADASRLRSTIEGDPTNRLNG